MAITEKRPSTKYTVGAQYICLNTNKDWDAASWDTNVLKLPTVVDIDVADNSDSYQSYASGAVYDSDTLVTYKEINHVRRHQDKAVLRIRRADHQEGQDYGHALVSQVQARG